MAVPSRVFVGLVVFGLIAGLALVPYTLLVLSGYQPPPNSVFLPEPDDVTFGDKLVLVLASLFAMALTTMSWRSLVTGARRDAERRRIAAEQVPRRPPT